MAEGSQPLVKICGTQDPESAVIAATAGADFIGMIFVPKSKCVPSHHVCPAAAGCSVLPMLRLA